MNQALAFNLLPTPICPDSVMGKSQQAADVISRVRNLLPQTTLKRLGRIPPICGYFCQSKLVRTFGKGFNPEQAEASALMEHLERLTWQTYPFASQDDYQVTTFAKIFVSKKSLVNASYFLANNLSPTNWTTYLPTLGQIPLHWLTAWSFSREKPLAYPVNWHNISYTTNGLASGANLSEALLQGLCEVIERENIWRWLAEGRNAPLVDSDTINDAECRQILQSAKKIGIELQIRNTSFVADIPCYSVYGCFHTPNGRVMHFSSAGHGCHPFPLLALKRALSEYLASHEINPGAAGPTPNIWSTDLPAMDFRAMVDFNRDLLETSQKVPFQDTSAFQDNDLTGLFYTLCRILYAEGYDVAARILNPGAPLPVVRVLVPNMRALFGTEVKEYLLLLSQVAHEGGNRRLAIDLLVKALENPDSEIFKQLAGTKDNPLVAQMLHLMGSSLFFGKNYQETINRCR